MVELSPNKRDPENSIMNMQMHKQIDAKQREQENLAHFLKVQEDEKSMFLPNNTQYTRLVQKVSNSLKKTKFSPISPQNKHSSAV